MSKLSKLVLTPVHAGFPNPAADASDTPLDLNRLVVSHPAATFYMRVEGRSMEGAGILDGDLVAIDKSLEPGHGDIVVAYIDSAFTLKRFEKRNGKALLVAENPEFEPIEPQGEDDAIWGVVIAVIRQLRTTQP